MGRLQKREALYYILPGTSDEDRQQLREVDKLEGKTLSRSRKVDEIKELSYGLVPVEDAIPLWTGEVPDPEVIEKLSEWLLAQSEIISHAVLDYLDEPNEDQLHKVLRIIGKTFKPVNKEITLTELITRALPTTLEKLYVMARREHRSKRPEAAVRTILRGLEKRREVYKDEQGRYKIRVEED